MKTWKCLCQVYRSKKLRHVHNSVSMLACILLIKLYSKNTSGPCSNLNISYLTKCKFVGTFCASDRSAPFWRQKLSVKTWIIKYCRQFLKKIDISGSIGPNKSLKTGKFSLAQASVKWKFVTDVMDIFGLFLSPSRFCFHACR